MLKKSIDLDPDYALAYTGLAWIYVHQYAGFGNPEYRQEFERYHEQAYILNPDLAQSNVMRGIHFFYEGNYREAFDYYRKALRLNANNAEINALIGISCRQTGMVFKAIPYFERAVALNPFYLIGFGAIGISNWMLGDYERAYQYLSKLVEARFSAAFLFRHFAFVAFLTGRQSQGQEMHLRLEGMNPASADQVAAFQLALEGKREEALETYQGLLVYALLGMAEEAVAELQRNVDNVRRDHYLFLENNTIFDTVRKDIRFQEVLKRKKEVYEEMLKISEGL
jgi:tetratricopeptide (TPR) repeat protein